MREEDPESHSTEMECDSIAEGTDWTPEQKKMGALTAKLERQMAAMDQRMNIIEIELAELCEEIGIRWAEGRRQEGNDGA